MRSRGKVIFVGGGARTGKSRLAQKIAESRDGPRVYVATGAVTDDEMRARVRQHRADRAGAFATLEVELDLVGALAQQKSAKVVLLDCLTSWIANLLVHERTDEEIERAVYAFVDGAGAYSFDLVVVSNEVGMGVVPSTALGRRFRDLTGRAHQALFRQADEVYFGALGCMLRLKPGPVEVATI